MKLGITGRVQDRRTIEPRTKVNMPSSRPLQIAVLGVGSIGSAYAFQLARTGRHKVTAVARPGSVRLQQLQRDRGIINTRGEHAKVSVTDTLDDQTPYDLVVVTLLAHQVGAVLPTLQRSAARCIQFMFNNFDPGQLRDAIGAERCCFGMPFVQARLDQDGKLTAKIGAGGQKSKMSRQASVEVFTAAGIPAIFEPDMLLWLRCHVPLCVAFESVSAAGMRRGGGASWGESMVLAHGMREGFALIQALGYRLYPSGKVLLSKSPAWVVASILWSVSRIRSFRELLATGAPECRALVDVMVAAIPQASSPISAAKLRAMKPPVETV